MRYTVFFLHVSAILTLISMPLMLQADEKSVFQYDSKPSLRGGIRFNQDDPKQIKRHDFKVLDYALMSNEQGERWATVTFENTSSGLRLLANEYLLAEFADGSQRFAVNLDGKVESGQILTRTVFFGYHRFPILRLQW